MQLPTEKLSVNQLKCLIELGSRPYILGTMHLVQITGIAQGNVYRILMKFKEDGLIAIGAEVKSNGLRIVKKYTLTEKGRELLDEILIYEM